MKTTIELPDALLRRAKVAAANRGTTLKELVISGLEAVLDGEPEAVVQEDPVERLRRGYHLGGKPLSREDAHGR